MSVLLTSSDIDYIREHVDEFKSNFDLGSKFGLTRDQMAHILYYNKIKRSYSNNGIVVFNKDFFGSYNEISCYWAGFIAADGCIGTRPNKVDKFLTIALKRSDKSHLENFIKHISGENLKIINRETTAISGGKKYPYSSVILYKTKIVDDLDEFFSIRPQKTLNTIFPPNIPEQYKLDYIRGYIDGDGSISVYKDDETLVISLSYVGNEDFVVKLAETIDIPYYPIKAKNNLFCISYSKFNSIRVIKKLYFPEDRFCLYRKRNKYFEYIDNMTEIQNSRLENYLNKFNEQI